VSLPPNVWLDKTEIVISLHCSPTFCPCPPIWPHCIANVKHVDIHFFHFFGFFYLQHFSQSPEEPDSQGTSPSRAPCAQYVEPINISFKPGSLDLS
jgi:hypothetical protein